MKNSIESWRIFPIRFILPALTVVLQFAFFAARSQTSPRYSVANGEYANFILDNSTQTLYGVGSGGTGIGSSNNVPGFPVACQFPTAGTKIAFVAAGLHTASCIDVSGNVYFTGRMKTARWVTVPPPAPPTAL